MEEILHTITQTTEGYLVKNLKFNLLDNIIVGLVKCPIVGREEIHEGYIACQWRKNGTATNRFKGRNDLKLKFEW